LPRDAVKNVAVSNDPNHQDINLYYGFKVVLEMNCRTVDVSGEHCISDNSTGRVGPKISNTGLIFGPFHTIHYGLYEVRQESDNVLLNTREVTYVIQPIPATQFANGQPLYCVNFLG